VTLNLTVSIFLLKNDQTLMCFIHDSGGNEMISYQQYIHEAAVSRQVIDRFVDPKPITYRDDKSKMIEFSGYLPS